MSDQNIFTEAPASWNVRYINPSGYVCQLTLRADQGSELLTRAEKALVHLTDNGCQPVNGNGYKPPAAPRSRNDQDSAVRCSIHEVSMNRREKNGKVWYSHKAPDGSWCNGKKKGG